MQAEIRWSHLETACPPAMEGPGLEQPWTQRRHNSKDNDKHPTSCSAYASCVYMFMESCLWEERRANKAQMLVLQHVKEIQSISVTGIMPPEHQLPSLCLSWMWPLPRSLWILESCKNKQQEFYPSSLACLCGVCATSGIIVFLSWAHCVFSLQVCWDENKVFSLESLSTGWDY